MTDTMIDPFAVATDLDDPFATPEDTQSGGGEFKPNPKPEYLDGALVAMVPRKHDAQAKKLERFVKTGESPYQERWTVDLYVIEGPEAGADLSFWYNKVDRDTKAVSEVEYVIAAANMPEAFHGNRVYQWGIIGQLNKVADGPRPILMGRVARGPKAADERNGKTFEDVANEIKAWEARGRKGERPGFAWKINQAVSEADRAKALAWYAQAKPDLTAPIARTTEPTN